MYAEQTTWRTVLIVGFFVAIATGLSLFFFSQQSLRLDEAQSLWQTGRSPTDILTIVAQDVHVPFYHELLHFWRLYIGDSVMVARLFSLFCYLLAIPAIYALGRLAYNRSSGLFVAGLFAISPFLNWYAAEIRMYTLFVLLVILNQYCFLKIWKTNSDHAWIGYILTALAGVYSHYFFFLLLGSQAVFYFLRPQLFAKGTLKKFIFAAALIAVAFAPWAAYVLLQDQAANASPALARPTTVDLFSTVAQFMFGFDDDHLNTFVLSLWPVTLILGFIALRKTDRLSPETEYFLVSVILPIVAVFGLSFIFPLFVSRYLIFTVPALYLLVTTLLASYPPRAAAWTRAGLATAMAVMLVVEMVSSSTPTKENYREVAQYLSQNAGAQDAVVLSAPFTVYPIEYYYRGEAPISTLPVWDRYAFGAIPAFNADTLPQEVDKTTADHQNIWLVLSYNQGYEQTIKDYFDQHYQKVVEKDFSPGLNLYMYKIRYDTLLSQLGTSTARAK